VRVVDRLHGEVVFGRRVRVLSAKLATVIGDGASVLDVGCGDGSVARSLLERRPDVTIEGVDVLVRPVTHIPVTAFDGSTLPFEDDSFDEVMFVDVLHHTEDPRVLIAEARRVARNRIIIKDHVVSGLGAVATLRLMDRVGNARHGISLPYNYWRERQWLECFEALDLEVELWQGSLGLYPVPARFVFDRHLHVLCRLATRSR
jgi:SAM-dependent methyltransferase